MEPIRFCAIDPSITCTAISILSMNTDGKFDVIDKTSLKVAAKFKDRWEKKLKVYELYKYYLNKHVEDISFFVFENYSYGSPGHLSDLGELNGLFKFYLSCNKKPFDTITPSEVKKIITGSGRADKKQILEALPQFLSKSIVFNNFDESDSVAIGIAYAKKMGQYL